MHQRFSTTVDHLFETNRLDQNEAGIEYLKRDCEVQKDRDQYIIKKQDGKLEYIDSKTFQSRGKVCMPKLATNILSKLQK